MSSHPTLPISSKPRPDQSIPAVHPNPKSPFYVRIILTRLRDLASHALSNRRPWTELIDRTAFSRPSSFSDAASRVRKNAAYFRVNYLTLLAIVLAYFLISHPLSLLTLTLLVGAWLFLYALRPSDQPLLILGRTFSHTQTLTALGLVTVVAVLVTGLVSLLVSAAIVAVAVVCGHGAFRDPEDLFLDEQESSGFFSFVGGAASSGSAALGPSMISIV
ncbi:Prenylated rab acceptor [Trema orientale]|uniref:PRA1 family protein n=1 Tax=Trema orientale TaxID=63057 RepID=A0A2P5EJX2_TREOI|nr:Prenylated rab acceptor [Trema orientale]